MAELEIEFYDPPNPAVTATLNGNQLRAILLLEAKRAQGLYLGIVTVGERPDPHRLIESTSAFTERQYGAMGSRWVGVLEVNNDHVLPHELGWETLRDHAVEGERDLNHVLEML